MPPRKESTGTPPTGLQQFECEGFTSLCSPAGPYKEEAYWLEKIESEVRTPTRSTVKEVRTDYDKSQDNTRHRAFMFMYSLHAHPSHTHEPTHTHTHTRFLTDMNFFLLPFPKELFCLQLSRKLQRGWSFAP